MARYRIHRIKDIPREGFRWAPHTSGAAAPKLKDYDPGGEVEAPTPYAVWKSLLADGRPLRPGDLLETCHVDGAAGELYITKYIGFEPAAWRVSEPRPAVASKSEDGGGSSTVSLHSDPV